jgi:hypothetical protein
MIFLQPTIEAKLSAALGAAVKFGQLKVSALLGTVTAENMTIAGESPDRPMLSVRRITAQLSVSKALLGQISIKEMVIEGPQLTLTPKFRPPAPPSGRGSGKFEAQSIRINQGSITFQKDSHMISIEQISGAITQHAGNIEFNASIGRFAGIGAAEVLGRIAGDDWSMIPSFAASAEVRFAEGLSLSLKSSRLADWQVAIGVTGSVNLQKVLSVLAVPLLAKIEMTANIGPPPPGR